ncbi:hypothetical protein Asp14428_76060 [Actinoplanes sp. NBRC 14428]|nr:hypothetical protein Asp14428_76060 [Actinoplanes sp. NBRC 14428]
MAPDSLQFPVSAVHRHADTVDQVSQHMVRARSAVREVTMDAGAYGQLCQFLPAMLSPVFEMAVDLLDEATDALQQTAADLHTTATEAEVTDLSGAQRVEGAYRAPARGLDLPL